MRTVHETEALRPSDPVPKSMQAGPPSKSSKLKIIIKTPQSHGNGGADDESGHGEDGHSDYFTALTSELFTADELAFSVDKLYRKCFWEAKWADEVGETLKRECKEWEDVYYKEWLEKETLLSQVIQSEVDWHERRQAVLAGSADIAHINNGTSAVVTSKEGEMGTVEETKRKTSAERENGVKEKSPNEKADTVEPATTTTTEVAVA